jgi:GTP-binding protein Era
MVLRSRDRGRVGRRRLSIENPRAFTVLGFSLSGSSNMTKAGIVTVVGAPNVGKSTLLNRVVGQKLSITSPKPQSTRDRIVGIRTEGQVQMVFFDTPGLLTPSYDLQRAMRGTALRALEDADVIVYLVEANQGAPKPLHEAADVEREPKAPIILTFNKIDTVSKGALGALREEYPTAQFVSASQGDGVEDLLTAIAHALPESPFLYPEDEVSTQSLRFFAAELIREAALEQLDEEVPYSVAAEIDEFREDRRPVYIRATVFVERESQKGILIGHKGARIRELGKSARLKIEPLVDAPVFLDLHVKVLPNWRRDRHALGRFGFTLPPEETR